MDMEELDDALDDSHVKRGRYGLRRARVVLCWRSVCGYMFVSTNKHEFVDALEDLSMNVDGMDGEESDSWNFCVKFAGSGLW